MWFITKIIRKTTKEHECHNCKEVIETGARCGYIKERIKNDRGKNRSLYGYVCDTCANSNEMESK